MYFIDNKLDVFFNIKVLQAFVVVFGGYEKKILLL